MFLCASVKKNLCECISLTQRAQSYRDAKFYGFTQKAQNAQNFYFAPLSFTLRMADASVTCVLCEFCVFCVQ